MDQMRLACSVEDPLIDGDDVVDAEPERLSGHFARRAIVFGKRATIAFATALASPRLMAARVPLTSGRTDRGPEYGRPDDRGIVGDRSDDG